MFFILSKLLGFLISPIIWIAMLLIFGRLSKKTTRKKGFYTAACILFFVCSNGFLFEKVMVAWQPKRVCIDTNTQYSAGILLGGMYGFDADKNGHFTASSDRFIQTIQLYHQHHIQKIIIAAGSAKVFTKEPFEADSLKAEMIKCGIKQEDIIIDSLSRNTYENAINTKNIIQKLALKPPYLLITSAFHMPRSSMVFNKQGLQTVAYPCNYVAVKNPFSIEDILIPNLKVIDDWKTYFIREVIGILMYKLTNKA